MSFAACNIILYNTILPAMMQSLTTRDYVEEFCKLDFHDREELGNDLMVNKFGYFMFDVRKLDIVETLISHLLSNPYKAKKIYIFGNYSVVCAILEKLIENGLHLQVIMLDIEINIWDNVIISWELLSNFTKLKFLNVDDSNGIGSNKFIPDITAHLPAGLEALSIVNMLDYNEPFSPQIVESNLKVIKIGVMNKWNQPLMGLPTGLETLIIKSGEFNQRMENLPGGLKHLILLSWKFTMPLDRLPHGLEYFAGLHFPSLNYLLGNYDKELTNLPSSIKSVLLDKNLFEKQGETLKSIYPECQIKCYNFRSFEFIMMDLLEWMV